MNKWRVFAGASLALAATSALGVAAGGTLSQFIRERQLHFIAGIGFIAIGIWTLFKT